jgi:hypothetical protein
MVPMTGFCHWKVAGVGALGIANGEIRKRRRDIQSKTQAAFFHRLGADVPLCFGS